MSIDDWGDLFGQTVTIQPFLSRTSYGVASYASPATYAARVNYRNTLVRGRNGEQVVARGTIWLKSSDRAGDFDLLTLPDGTSPQIISTETIADETGPLYTKIYFG